MILQTAYGDLIEPQFLTTELALLIIFFLLIFAFLVMWLRHAILGIVWMITIIVFGMTVLIDFDFIWVWILIMTQSVIVGFAVLWRYIVIPIQSQNG